MHGFSAVKAWCAVRGASQAAGLCGGMGALLQVFADDGAHHHKAERHACVSYDTYGFQVGR